MHCSSCGADLLPDARFCTACGHRVELGTMLGVGTDLPPAPTSAELAEQARRAREEAARRAAGQPPVEPDAPSPPVASSAAASSTASGAFSGAPGEVSTPEPHRATGLDDTAAMEPVRPREPTPTAARATGPRGDDGPYRDERSARGSGTFTPGRVAAMVATFVLLTVIGTFALSALFGSGDPDSDAADSTTSTAPASPSASEPPASTDTEPSPTEPSPTESSQSPSPSPTSTTLPKSARRCTTKGGDEVATAWSGNRDTSCAFSNAVRAAYRKADAATTGETFRAYSTVTKRWYDVTCGTGPYVRCQSADGAAVVFLGP